MATPSRFHFLAGLMLAAGLTSCADLHRMDAPLSSNTNSCASSPDPAENARLAAVQQMAQDGKLHAALAQLDTLKQSWPQADLLRADVSRRIERTTDAESIYRRLQEGCLAGQVQHGLGLIAASRGDLPASLDHFAKARKSLPTDPHIRNDYGYALLLGGDLDAAQFELLTALDLMPGNRKAASNLVLLAFIRKKEAEGRDLARKFGMTDNLVTELQDKATRWPAQAVPASSEQAASSPPTPVNGK